MKISRYLTIALLALTFAACNDIDEQEFEGGALTADQLKETNEAIESRIEASFVGMFTMMGQPKLMGYSTPHDYGFVMTCLVNDLEGSDAWIPDNNYNWFSACGEWSSRNPSYYIPFFRYGVPYKQIKIANDIIGSYDEATTDPTSMNRIAQAKACRAFDYMNLASFFQFNYADHKADPCVPLVTEKTLDAATNPRATVEEIYNQILEDLTYACEVLEDFKPTNKNYISGAVAYGLRARAYLAMEEWEKAAEDADKAIQLSGATPATIDEVSTPSFYNIEDHNWLWGYDMTVATQEIYKVATVCSWTVSFSAYAYAASDGCYLHINKLLYDKISDTDVRKGWWLDENLHSPLLSTISWDGVTGDAIAPLEIEDTKLAMDAYTNVKFGMYSGIGSTTNDNDFPFMRVEEMILVKAEGLAKSGKESEAKQVLSEFVKTYRDPSYDIDAQLAQRSLADEIWFQRRVELWGEGFNMGDIMRLKKPMVRFHSTSDPYPDNFRFNVEYGDPYTLLRFPRNETNNNSAIVNNEGGNQPNPGQNPELRDGVTD